MRSLALLSSLLFALPLSLALDASHWSSLAAGSKTGIIHLTSETYDQLLSPDRDYSATIVLTALPASFKCAPCHDFDPSFQQVASSWKRMPKDVRDQHFFAQLDFSDGQAVYQRLGLSSAPTVQHHPALSGPNKGNKLSVITYDLNRNGLSAPSLHGFLNPLVPQPFALHTPTNPIPFILVPLSLFAAGLVLYSLAPYLLPLVQSRLVWGTLSLILILTFTSGYMWNKIKNAPYVAIQNGKTSWIAGGFQNQLGLESQVVGSLYGMLSFSIIALTLFVPAQSNATKQRIGVYLWLAIFIVLFSLLVKLFKIKNGGYPFTLLF
ncbi:putative dolichyl-diphosphooligosaccharide-protein glycotransferase [Naematelia encephala]|uniref:Putative dolichyl-diphosphooligosaccharide-protein glycotransferase n=1 Tax=Naematelia encephala TaxID=71784 RepID=A0A1Y2AJA6_9TREE|nr:putative dolichyl-diphosphooligosaccharide-protein glycotransferase [Naematelia encephala]